MGSRFSCARPGAAPPNRADEEVPDSRDDEVLPAKPRPASSAAAVNGFGLQLLRALQPASSADSVFISPLSISSALVRVALGATPKSAAMKRLMGIWGLEEKDANAFASDLRNIDRTLMSLDAVKVLSANSIWCTKTIKETYKTTLAKFGTEAMQLTGVGPVNAWVEKATEGMIPQILTNLDPNTVAVIVNAVYFKGAWQGQFKVKNTKLGKFKKSTGGMVPCAMMTRLDNSMHYMEYSGAQVAELLYQGSQVSAMVVLPKQGKDPLKELSELLELFATGDALSRVHSSLGTKEVMLQMPRFKLEFGIRDLKQELLQHFGLRPAFESFRQFLNMTADPEVRISNVFHKAVVKVNEEGTEAAAATAVVMKTRSLARGPKPRPKEMIVDRPFLFLIRERETGMILFAGTVVDPELDTTGL